MSFCFNRSKAPCHSLSPIKRLPFSVTLSRHLAIFEKHFINFLLYPQRPRKGIISLSFDGTGHFFYTFNLLRISGFSIVWNNVAKNFTDLLNKWHFLAFNRNPEDRSRSNTLPKFTIISSNLFLIIMVSSSKTRHMSYCNPTSFISLSNVTGAQQSPNGITLNWNIPLWVKKRCFTSVCKVMFYQYTENVLMVENQL